jgi:hypothetical protein
MPSLGALPLEETPVFYAPAIGYHVVTRYADVEQVFRDPQTYSAAVAQQPLARLVPEAAEILLAGGHKPQPSLTWWRAGVPASTPTSPSAGHSPCGSAQAEAQPGRAMDDPSGRRAPRCRTPASALAGNVVSGNKGR